jgi:hypothetical protein
MTFMGTPDVAAVQHLGALILATAGLGTAAMGIVEAMKWTALGEAGFHTIPRILGPLCTTLRVAYGDEYERLMRAQYRGNHHELSSMLHRGVRAGLSPRNARAIAEFLGSIDGAQLRAAVRQRAKGQDLEPSPRTALGRFELAADAHIDAALVLARSRYAGTVRAAASIVALSVAVIAGLLLGGDRLLSSMLVGIAAVPVAPIAKDLASALTTVTASLRDAAALAPRRSRAGGGGVS